MSRSCGFWTNKRLPYKTSHPHAAASWLILSLCLLLWKDSALAQTRIAPAIPETSFSSEPSPEIIPALNVTATRSKKKAINIPSAVNRVDRPAIQNSKPTVTLAEALSQIPGLFLQNQFNFAQDLRISIRGFGVRSPFGVRGVKVLVDGIPETLADGQTQLDSIDPGIIDHIEVIRGPSSSLYGNASGGVIAITTEDGPESGLEISPRFAFGGFGFAKQQLKISKAENNFRFRLYASHLELKGFREHSETENTLVQGKIRVSPSSRSGWTFTFGHFNSPQALDPGALTQDQVDTDPQQANARNLLFSAGEKVQQQNFGIRYRINPSARHEIVVTSHLIHRNFSNKLPFLNGGIVEFERIAPGAGIKSIYDGKFIGQPNRLIAGVDSQYQRDDRQRFNNRQGAKGQRVLDQVEEVLSVGPYLRNELQLTGFLDLVGGVRYDRIYYHVGDSHRDDGNQSGSRTLSQFSGTVGAVAHLHDSLHLYGNVATIFEAPTTTELINNPSGGGGFNPNLDSQTSRSYEVGVKGNINPKFNYELALFFIRSEKEIIPFELPQFPQRAFFRNAGASERKGLELSINLKPLPGVETALSYAYSDFQFTDFVSGNENLAGKDIPGIPRNRLHGQINYKHPSGFFAQWETQYVGDFFVDNSNIQKNESYILGNFRLGAEKAFSSFRGSVHLGLNNVFDKTYNANTRINAANGRFFEPAPPFNLYGGVSITYLR